MIVDTDPSNGENWELRCRVCDLTFDTETTMGVVAAHWNAEHVPPEDEDAPKLELKWVGLGPPPPPRLSPFPV